MINGKMTTSRDTTLPGNSVIRMLHNWLGAEPFRKGLALYLKRHQYKNALTEDLWAALEESSGKPVNKVLVIDVEGAVLL